MESSNLIFQNIISETFLYTYILLVIIAPFVLGIIFFQSFVTWRRNAFIHKQKSVLLEINLPKEVAKSPLAMELFFTSLYQTKGEGTWIERWIKGKVRPWFSLELISNEGEISFYIWTWEFWRSVIESGLYAQYPEIEITEVEDYAKKIHLDTNKMDLWGTVFKLSKSDYYPIKSYADYNLDKDPDEELKIDPMTPVFEYLGNLRKGEQAWIQIIVRAHKKERKKHGTWFQKVDWSEAANEEIKKIKEADKKQIGDIEVSGLGITQADKDTISAIQRNISKLPFDCGIRAIYLAKKDAFRDINIAGLNGAFRQYNAINFNSFETDAHHTTSFDYPWQDFTGKKLLHRKEHILHEYKERAYFHLPYKSHFFTMNTESLATIFHFPGSVAKTPSLHRVSAKKSEPPSNLPK